MHFKIKPAFLSLYKVLINLLTAKSYPTFWVVCYRDLFQLFSSLIFCFPLRVVLPLIVSVRPQTSEGNLLL